MFLREAIRARVASFLRPWMEEEPRFELELGLLSSRATARDLLLRPSALNFFLEESSALCFESVRIGEVVVHLSPVSSPLLKIEARGIRFGLKFRGSDQTRRSGSSAEARKKERIERLDPEGILLHNAIANILKERKCGSSIVDSLTSVIIGNCQVWLNDIDFQIHIPIDYGGPRQIGASDKLYLVCLGIGEFSANGQVTGYYELLKGILEVLIMGRDLGHLVFSLKNVYIKLKQRNENYPTSCILFIRSLLLSTRMKKLQLLEFEIDIPEVDAELSHREFFFIILIHAMLNTNNNTIRSSDYNLLLVEEAKRSRNGKMWKKAACQMHNLLPSFRLWRLVNLVLVWYQYVKIYELLLKQVSYPAPDLFCTLRWRLLKDVTFSNNLKHLWEKATEMENGLPAEGVALARRVARHRSTVSSHISSGLSDDAQASFLSFALVLIPTLLKGISLIVHLFNFMLHKVIHAIYSVYRLVWHGVLNWNTESEGQNLLPEDSIYAIDKPELVEGNQRILVTVSKFVVNIIPGDLPQVSDGESSVKPLPVDLLALRFVFDQLYLDFAAEDNTHRLTFACGELVSHSYSLSRSHRELDTQIEKDDSVKGYGTEERGHGYASEIVLSSSPFVQISLVELGSQCSFSSDSFRFLKDHIDEMYLKWKSSYGFLKLKHVGVLAKPFILCRLETFIISPHCTASNFGLLKLGLSMGKLTCKLDFSLFIFIYSQTIRLFEHYFYTRNALSQGAIPKSFHDRKLRTDVDFDKVFYDDRLKMRICRIVFHKQVVIGAAMVGPKIQLSFPAKDSPIYGKNGFRHITTRGPACITIALDLKNIYSAVWSASSLVSTAHEKEDNGSGACSYKWLKKPPLVSIPEADTNKRFIVQGQLGHNFFLKLEDLSLSLEPVMENQQQNILKPVSLTLESSYCRKYLHSLATVATVMSMTLVSRATDLIISLCMEELEEVFQVLGISLSAVSHISSACTISRKGDLPTGIEPSQDMWATEYKCAEVDSQQRYDSFIVDGTKFVVDINLEFRPLDIILNNYRNLVGHISVAASATRPSKNMLSFPNTGAKFVIKKSSISFFWEEEVSVSLLLELAGIQSLILGNKMESPLEVLMKNEVSDDCDVLCEVSLSTCSFSLVSGINARAVLQDTAGNVVSRRRLSCNDVDTLQNTYFLYSDNNHLVDGSRDFNLNPDSSWMFSWIPSSARWLLVHFKLSEIFIVENSTKIVNVVKNERHADMNSLEAVIAVSKGCHAISSEIQGGIFLLETKALVVSASSLRAYTLFFSRLLCYFPCPSEVSDPKSSSRMKTSKYLNQGASIALQLNRDDPDYVSSCAPSSDVRTTLLEVGWKSLKVLTVSLSQISIKFVVTDAYAGVRELDIETNFLFKYEKNPRKNFFFDLSRFAIRGLRWGRPNNYMEMGVQAPRFRSSILSNTEATVGSVQPHASEVQESNSSDSQAPGKKLLDSGQGFCFYGLTCQNLILKCMTASVMIDEELPGTTTGSRTPKDGWGGTASVSGVDLKITIPEIQVQHCTQRKGFSSVFCFSLISLYAKNGVEEPLRMNFKHTSNLVDISGTDDKGGALWQAIPYRPSRYEGNDELETYNRITEKAFYLLNCKSDLGVAFVDQLPLFVKKPGSLFKMKIISPSPMLQRVNSAEASSGYLGNNASDTNMGRNVAQDVIDHRVNVFIEGVCLTILHEVSIANDNLPLLRVSINNIHCVIQVLSSKFRLITSFRTVMENYDYSSTTWREVVSPVEICMFIRLTTNLEARTKKVPFNFHCSIPKRNPDDTPSISLQLLLGEFFTSPILISHLKSDRCAWRTRLASHNGNFLISVRPKASEVLGGPSNLVTLEWSEDLKGGKPVRLSGLFGKLSYQLKKGFGGKSVKAAFSSIKCHVQSQESVCYVHFLVQSIGKDVPVFRPSKVSSASHLSASPVAIQEQKEIYLLPTVQVYNVLQSEIHVTLSETVEDSNKSSSHIGRQAVITSGSSACFYVNPSIIYFTFALTEFGLKCKPLNSSEIIKKLNRSMSEFHHLDKELDFGGGKFIANLRFSRGDRGTLEITIFTSSVLRNSTDVSFFCCDANSKSISREDPAGYWSTCSPEQGFVLDPGSTASWFFRSSKVRLLWLKDKVVDAVLDLQALSGFSEIGSELLSEIGVKHIMKFGISLKPISSKVIVPSRLVHIVPRYVVSNQSDVDIYVRQSCVHSDDMDGVTVVTSHQKSALQMQSSRRKRKTSIIDSMFRSHSNGNDDSMYFIQYCLNEDGWGWSGPVCVTSLGHFFLRFRRKPIVLGHDEPDCRTQTDDDLVRVGTVDIEEEESMLVMRFCLPSNILLPYRIENNLNDSAILYYQKDVGEREASDNLVFLQGRVENVCLHSLFADNRTFNVVRVQSLNVDEKWQGAPFAALLRRSQLDNNEAADPILSIIITFQPGNSSVTEVNYCSIVVQPLDLNFDEETVMKLVPFWRTSLSDPNSTRQQIYFKHFEIHPIKIIASFLPGNLNVSYSTSQEALRSFLHSVIKVPTVKAAVMELNGVLLTHALLTTRELFIKCLQHYSWYAMRAIYIAKGSSLLPPSFASIFDDSAFSSLDVFFDPSSSLHSLPGLTVGALKFIRKSIDGKGVFGTRRYLGDLEKTLRRAGSNILFAAMTEISDSVLRGAETSGVSGMVKGFHQGILHLAMEPTLIGSAFMEGGGSRRIKLDHSPGINEAYIEGYLQAMLDVLYKLEYLKVRVIDDEVLLKNLPPNSSLISDIVEHVKGFLIREGLLKGEPNASSLSTRRLYGGQEWKFGPMLLTLSEHLFVSFAIRFLRKQTSKVMDHVRSMRKERAGAVVPAPLDKGKKVGRKQALGKFVLSSVLAYIDGRLCRCIPNTIARRIVSGFLLSFLDENDTR
ncbi:unnamed protein product [Victoria cruziana]